MNKFITAILKKFNAKNISNAIDALNKGTKTFNKAVQDFGDSMDTITKELSSNVQKSNRELKIREKKNKENLDKIWGNKND